MTETTLIKYPEYPEEIIPRNYDYTVRITQGEETIEIPVYNPVYTTEYFNGSMGGDWHRRFCEFAFSGEPVTIEVAVNMDFSSYTIMPSSRQIASTCKGNLITYTIDKPQNTVIKINDNRDTMLAIFAEEPLVEIPDKNDPKTIYFEAGYHEVEGGVIRVNDGETIFLEPGALVKARMILESGCSLKGRGAMIEPSPTRMPVDAVRFMLILKGSNINVEGIKVLDAHTFNIACTDLFDSEIKDVKVLSNQISTDGFSIWGTGKNVDIHHCFWHVSDNIFIIGGIKADPFENFHIHDCIVASDFATFFPQQQAIGQGEMHFKNIDVLRCGSFMKVTYNPEGTEVGFGNFKIENIYAMDVENSVKFIWFDKFKNGAKTISMKNVNLRAIKDVGCEVGADVSGFNVNFDNVWIGGELFTNETPIQNSMNPETNSFSFADTCDADAALVGVNNLKGVPEYIAPKIKIGALSVGEKVQPFTQNGTMYVSAYEIIKQLGFADIKLDEATGKLSFADDKKAYTFTADGENILKNGRLMVPIALFEKIGTTAKYDETTKTITIENIKRDVNLIKNPDFENGLSIEWTTRNFSQLYLSTDAHSGKYAIKVMKKGSKENGIYQDVARVLKQNGEGTYKATAYVKKTPESDSTIIHIGYTGGFGLNATPLKAAYELTNDWQKIEYIHTAEDVESIRMASLFVGAVDGTEVEYLIDDISFVKLD